MNLIVLLVLLAFFSLIFSGSKNVKNVKNIKPPKRLYQRPDQEAAAFWYGTSFENLGKEQNQDFTANTDYDDSGKYDYDSDYHNV
jgi:hypothetical protein